MWRGCWKACWTPADRHPPYRTRQGTPMKHKPCLDLQDIKTIAQAAEAHATARGWAVSIAIADDGGHLLWLQRLDGAAPASAHIAPAKAHAAALGRKESRLYEEMINGGRTAYLSVPALQGLLEGGVPITSEGHCLGAVGVSGDRKSTRLNSSHVRISYAVFCLKKKKNT